MLPSVQGWLCIIHSIWDSILGLMKPSRSNHEYLMAGVCKLNPFRILNAPHPAGACGLAGLDPEPTLTLNLDLTFLTWMPRHQNWGYGPLIGGYR